MDPALEQALRTHAVDVVLDAPPAGVVLRRVGFERVVLPDSIDTQTYDVFLAPDMGAHDVAALFPNNARCPVLWASSFRSLHKWNKALNVALNDSLDELEDASSTTCKLCIAHGKQLYACGKVIGRVYVFWAMVRGSAQGLIGMQVPVLINTDGKMEMRAMMPLRSDEVAERIPLTAESPRLMWNWKLMGGHPFVCDERHYPARVSTVAPAPMHMLSAGQARYTLTRTMAAANAGFLQTHPLLGHNQFEHSMDAEHHPAQPGEDDTDDDDSGITVEISSASGSDPDAAPPLPLRLVRVSAQEK